MSSSLLLPPNLRNVQLYSQVTELIDYLFEKEEEILIPILHKYSRAGDLSRAYLLKIMSELGYSTIANMTGLTDAEIQKIFNFIDLIHKHKESRKGLDIFLQLLALTYEIREWWEWKLYTSNWQQITANSSYYDYEKYPLTLYREGTVEDTWTISFIDSTHFSIQSSYLTENNVSILNDYQPENGDSYFFKILASGWGVNAWQAGDVVIFTTHNKSEMEPHTFELELALSDSNVSYKIASYLVDFVRAYVYPILNQITVILSDIATIAILHHSIFSEIEYFGSIVVEDSANLFWDDDAIPIQWDDFEEPVLWD